MFLLIDTKLHQFSRFVLIVYLFTYVWSEIYLHTYMNFGEKSTITHTYTPPFQEFSYTYTVTKGQLISRCSFGVIVWTKIPTKNLTNFCPRILKVVKSTR